MMDCIPNQSCEKMGYMLCGRGISDSPTYSIFCINNAILICLAMEYVTDQSDLAIHHYLLMTLPSVAGKCAFGTAAFHGVKHILVDTANWRLESSGLPVNTNWGSCSIPVLLPPWQTTGPLVIHAPPPNPHPHPHNSALYNSFYRYKSLKSEFIHMSLMECSYWSPLQDISLITPTSLLPVNRNNDGGVAQ